MTLTVSLGGFGVKALRAARTVHHRDLNAANTRDSPDTVRPVALEGVTKSGETLLATLPPASWNIIRLG
jgi:alpha-N-arabinofuranosidase